jgi:Tol biopolymer transport system component
MSLVVLVAAALAAACDPASKTVAGPTTGELDVTLTTAGADNPGGFSLSLDGAAPAAIASDAKQVFLALDAGPHSAELGGLGTNCTASPNPATATVVAGRVAGVAVHVTCANRRIVFQRGYSIYTINSDGSGLAGPLAPGPIGTRDMAPVWSPDGARIAFISTRASLFFSVFVMNADGSGLEQITTDGAYYSPAWSPDGTLLAASHVRSADPLIFNIAVITLATHAVRQLHDESGIDFGPSWSPDGQRIIFGYFLQGSTFQIWTMTKDGDTRTALTNTSSNETEPRFSPNGEQIVFKSDRGGSNTQIYVMNADGTNQRPVTNSPSVFFDGPAWSPDGLKLIYASNRLSGSEQLSLEMMGLAGGGSVPIAPGTNNDQAPSFGR